MSATTMVNDCGCRAEYSFVDGPGHSLTGTTISWDYCPLHAAAPEMLSLLQRWDESWATGDERHMIGPMTRVFLATLDAAKG